MNVILLISIVIQYAYMVLCLNKGSESSLILLSKNNTFHYDSISNLVVFG